MPSTARRCAERRARRTSGEESTCVTKGSPRECSPVNQKHGDLHVNERGHTRTRSHARRRHTSTAHVDGTRRRHTSTAHVDGRWPASTPWTSRRARMAPLAALAHLGRMHVAQTDLPFRRGSRKRVRTRGRTTSSVWHSYHSEYGIPAVAAAAADHASSSVAISAGLRASARLGREAPSPSRAPADRSARRREGSHASHSRAARTQGQRALKGSAHSRAARSQGQRALAGSKRRWPVRLTGSNPTWA